MIYTFKKLFQVLFSHDYYDSGFVEGLEITPSLSTQRLMSGNDLLFQNQPGGFLVATQVDQNNSKDVTEPSAGIALAFYLRVKNDVFYKVTQIPVKRDMMLYTNNLNQSKGLTTGDWQVLPCRISSWSYDLTDAVREAGFGFGSSLRKLEVDDGILVVSYCLKRANGDLALESKEAGVLRQIDLNLSHLPEGCYSLEVNLKNKQTLPEYRFVYSEAMNWTPALGMYEWFSQSQTRNLGNRISTDLTYKVNFQDVESFWRYYFVFKNNKVPSSLSLLCETLNGVAVSFGQGVKTEIPDGRSAICFSSNHQIPLRQSPSGEVEMKQEESDALRPLPYAAPGYVMEENFGKWKTFSDVYVYV